MGWIFNFSTGMIKVHPDKRTKLLQLIKELFSHSRTTKKTLEKFLGLALWLTHIFPDLRPFLYYLYADLYKAPLTLFSVDPGFWLTTISCLSDSLQFQTRPIGTAIPEGSQLVSVRHQTVNNMEDVRNLRLSEKCIWLRVRDPTSSRRSLSESSKRILHLFEHWLRFMLPQVSMNRHDITTTFVGLARSGQWRTSKP